MKDRDQRSTDDGVVEESWAERGYLLGEALPPDRARRIEAELRRSLLARKSSPGRRLLVAISVAAALLVAVVGLEHVQPRWRLVAESHPALEPVGPAKIAREMRLEIVRTDIPDAEPYRLQIELLPQPLRANEVTP